MSGLLPEAFDALEPFAAHWAGANAAERARLRDEAPPEGAAAFYARVQPLVASALEYLDRKPLADHDARERRLMRLLLAFAHVAMAIEVQQEDEPDHAKLRGHMRIIRAPADAS